MVKMILYKKGDILESSEDVICHQCNTEGIFGGGLALQIKGRFPICEQLAMTFAQCFGADVLGRVAYFNPDLGGSSKEGIKIIANCFTQNEDYTTNYTMLEKAFNEVMDVCRSNNLSLAIPYKYGCGIASGDWDTVLGIIDRLSETWGINVSIYYLEERVKIDEELASKVKM